MTNGIGVETVVDGQGTYVSDRRRFFQLTVGVWLAIIMGCNYAFGIISNYMKDLYSLSQNDLTTITTIGFCVAMIGLPAGAMFDWAGPRPTLIIAGCMSGTGFGGLAMSFAGWLPHSVGILTLWCVLINTGIEWMDVGSLLTNLFNFPLNRGDVIVIEKTFMGLGASILALYYEGFFRGKYIGYCVFVSVMLYVVCFLCAKVITYPAYSPPNRIRAKLTEEEQFSVKEAEWEYLTTPAAPWRMQLGFILMWTMLLMVTILSFVSAYAEPSDGVRITFAVICIALTFCFLLMLLPKSPFPAFIERRFTTAKSALVVDDADGSELGAPFHEVDLAPLGGKGGPKSGAEGSEEYIGLPGQATGGEAADTDGKLDAHTLAASPMASPTLKTKRWSPEDDDAATCSPDGANNTKGHSNSGGGGKVPFHFYTTPFLHNIKKEPIVWCMWWTSFAVWGTGLVIISNCAQIYRSLNHNVYEDEKNALYVAVIGLGNALGRIFGGMMEQRLSNKHKSMTYLYPIPATCIAIGLPLFLILPSGGIALPFALVSFGYGMAWAIGILAARFMFAVDVAKIYGFTMTGAMLSMILMNRLLFGMSFAAESEKQGIAPHCSGKSCVSTAFLVLTFVNASAILSAVGAHMIWMKKQRRSRTALVGTAGGGNNSFTATYQST